VSFTSIYRLIESEEKSALFLVGTRAEVIKIRPVIKRLVSAEIPVDLIWAGLHSSAALENVRPFLRNIYTLNSGDEDKETPIAVLVWFLRSNIKLQFLALRLRIRRKSFPLLLIHGDTLCTLMGALFAVTAKTRAGHIEAAVRSGAIFRPFPEEISRRIVSNLVGVHFAPGDKEFKKAQSYRGKSFDTKHNTSRDALYDDLENFAITDLGYLVVTLHRTELLSDRKKFSDICRELIDLSKSYEVRWFVGGHEKASLEKFNLLTEIENSSITLRSRTEHSAFVREIAQAHCVITDSGGLQSECHDMGIPVIVHRKESEYSGGPGDFWILTDWKIAPIAEFLMKLKGVLPKRGNKAEAVASDIIAAEIIQQIEMFRG
jgi:UDP-N-acetylglucosamine 2-epimerase (non-hydrolysing)